MNEKTIEYKGYLTEYQDDILKKINSSLDNEEDSKRFWEYRRKWDAAEKCNTHFDFPVNLDFELYDGCNLSCQHCVRKTKGYRVSEGNIRLGFELFKKLIDEGEKYGLSSISLGNSGEGLIEKDVVRMVKYAREKGVLDVWLSTNGLLLTPDLTRALLDAGLTRISISIDAMQAETYREVRGGDYEILMSNIHFLLEEKKRRNTLLPITRVTCIKLEKNKDETESFVEYWSKRVDCVALQEYIDFEQERKISKKDIHPMFCASPWRTLMIATDGTVTPCCTFHGKHFPLGNVHESTLKELWHSPRIEKLRDALSRHDYPKYCIDCHGVLLEDKEV